MEHAFGKLKGRFPYLQGIRGWDIRNMCRVIDSLLVLHNILHTLGDLPDDIDGLDLNAFMRTERENNPQPEFQQPTIEHRTMEDQRFIAYERRLRLLDYWIENSM